MRKSCLTVRNRLTCCTGVTVSTRVNVNLPFEVVVPRGEGVDIAQRSVCENLEVHFRRKSVTSQAEAHMGACIYRTRSISYRLIDNNLNPEVISHVFLHNLPDAGSRKLDSLGMMLLKRSEGAPFKVTQTRLWRYM